ncbi:hypothetical protein SEVIR_2G153500v4 [Setaria viridis]|uniref:Uncharacterized protein n=1 Tax=Setaria viridis TaxID=4556 RepID=A0A4U6VTY7_SETVI|nr:hypothetical protein SEVIR_2G153500v2 [Setaria viridis]
MGQMPLGSGRWRQPAGWPQPTGRLEQRQPGWSKPRSKESQDGRHGGSNSQGWRRGAKARPRRWGCGQLSRDTELRACGARDNRARARAAGTERRRRACGARGQLRRRAEGEHRARGWLAVARRVVGGGAEVGAAGGSIGQPEKFGGLWIVR